MMHIGSRKPLQECCHMSPFIYVNCQHEECMAYVHQFFQHDWLRVHCYEVPTNLPTFYQNHAESYTRWVRFTADEIPWSENGCIPGSVASTGKPRQGNNTPWMSL